MKKQFFYWTLLRVCSSAVSSLLFVTSTRQLHLRTYIHFTYLPTVYLLTYCLPTYLLFTYLPFTYLSTYVSPRYLPTSRQITLTNFFKFNRSFSEHRSFAVFNYSCLIVKSFAIDRIEPRELHGSTFFYLTAAIFTFAFNKWKRPKIKEIVDDNSTICKNSIYIPCPKFRKVKCSGRCYLFE